MTRPIGSFTTVNRPAGVVFVRGQRGVGAADGGQPATGVLEADPPPVGQADPGEHPSGVGRVRGPRRRGSVDRGECPPV